jgi:hypothetical protein
MSSGKNMCISVLCHAHYSGRPPICYRSCSKVTCPIHTPLVPRCLGVPTNSSKSETLETLRDMLTLYGEDLLTRRPPSRLEDYTLLAVRDCWFSCPLYLPFRGDHGSCSSNLTVVFPSALCFRATLRCSGLQQFDSDKGLRPMQSVRRQGVGLPLRRHVLRRMQGTVHMVSWLIAPPSFLWVWVTTWGLTAWLGVEPGQFTSCTAASQFTERNWEKKGSWSLSLKFDLVFVWKQYVKTQIPSEIKICYSNNKKRLLGFF